MALKDTIGQAIELLQSIHAESFVLQTEAPAAPDASPAPAPAPTVDPEALKVLQDKVDALAKENAALRSAIKAEIEDQAKDTARLEDAIADHSEPAPVPVVDVETVADVTKAEEKVSGPDDAAKGVSAGLQ